MKLTLLLSLFILSSCISKLVVSSSSNTSISSVALSASIQSPVTDTVVGNKNYNIYPVTFTTTDGGTASNYTASGLPAGLNINSATGNITGRPTQTGTFSVVVSANSSVANSSYSKTITFKIFNELLNDRLDTGSTVGMRLNGTSGYSSGWNVYGALLTGNNTDQTSSTILESSGLLSGLNVYKVGVDGSSCVGAGTNLDNMSLYCGGYGGDGELGNGSTTNNNPSPILFDISAISTSAKLRQFTVGYGTTCAIYENSTTRYLIVAGYNAHGELGNGTTTNINTPTVIAIPNGEIPKQVNCAYQFMSVLTESGKVYSSGENTNGQLGNGTTTDSHTLTQTNLSSALGAGEYPVKLVRAHGHSGGVITNLNRVIVWGKNDSGQLGVGDYVDKVTPLEIDTTGAINTETIIDVAMGYNHTVLTTASGVAYSMGQNVGQLCNGTTTPITIPTVLDTSGLLSGRKVLKVGAGFTETLLYLDDNKLVGCGQNSYGQLGVGDSLQHLSPTLILNTVTYPF